MDLSPAELDGIRTALLAEGFTQVNTITMAEDITEAKHAAEAGQNLVVSTAGLPAARMLQRRFGIPYTIGLALPPCSSPAETVDPAKRVLILGEAVHAKQLTLLLRQAGIDAIAGLTVGDDPAVFPQVPAIRLDTEAAIRARLFYLGLSHDAPPVL